MKKLICWIDKLDVRTVFRLLSDSRKEKYQISAIHYFGKITFGGQILSQCNSLAVKKFRYDTSKHDHSDGQAIFWHIWRDSYYLGWSIHNEILREANVINALPEGYDAEKWCLYLRRQIAYDQKRNLGIIRLVHWHTLENSKKSENHHILWLDGGVSDSSLDQYAGKFNLALNLLPTGKSRQIFLSLLKSFLCLPLYTVLWIVAKIMGKKASSGSPKIGVFLAQGLDVNKKSDISWFPDSGIDGKDVLVYSLGPLNRLTSFGRQYLEQTGIRIIRLMSKNLGWLKDIRVLSADYFGFLLSRTIENIKIYFKLKTKINPARKLLGNWQLEKIFWLLEHSLQYKAFFKSQNIKIHFGFLAEDDQNLMAVDKAIEQNGGTHIYAHWSNYPMEAIWSAHDVFFTWGSYYKQFYENMGSEIKNLIYSGYIFDNLSLSDKTNDEAKKYRQKLADKGVKFVICFFDNAYLEEGGWFSKESIVELQMRLLQLVKSNLEWGLILKPKRRTTFEVGVDKDVLQLLKELECEGRCLILESNVLPVTAGKVADLNIGLGSFGTSAVETALCGEKSIFYDPSLQSSNPFYVDGLNNIVFDDLEKMFERIDQFYKNKHFDEQGFANMDFVIDSIDPFRDGQAFRRIGAYIETVLAAYKAGKTKDEAIGAANKEYRRKFGQDKVVDFKNTVSYKNDIFEKAMNEDGACL